MGEITDALFGKPKKKEYRTSLKDLKSNMRAGGASCGLKGKFLNKYISDMLKLTQNKHILSSELRLKAKPYKLAQERYGFNK